MVTPTFFSGGHVSDSDEITADGQDGISFVNPTGEIFLHPLAGKTLSLLSHYCLCLTLTSSLLTALFLLTLFKHSTMLILLRLILM